MDIKNNNLGILKSRINNGTNIVFYNSRFEKQSYDHWSKDIIKDRNIIYFKKNEQDFSKENLKKLNNSKDFKNNFILFTDLTETEIFNYESHNEINEVEISNVCFHDTLSHLCKNDCIVFNWSEQFNFYENTYRTPIEQKLFEKFQEYNFNFKEQQKFGPYIVDFLIEKNNKKLIVEADGKEFHSEIKDKKRDLSIKEKFKIDTIRLSGTLINKNSQECVEIINNYFENRSFKKSQFIFESRDKLDKSQINAIQHKYGPARVVAPAGSGKTLVLVNHVVELINSGINPNGILCLAFNRDAAEQLIERLNSLKINNRNPSGKSGVMIATFNSYGYWLLRENGYGNHVIEDKETEEIAEQTINELNLNLPRLRGVDHRTNLLKSIAKIKRGLIPPSIETCSFEDKKGDFFEYPAKPIFDKYQEISHRRQGLTFDDQIYYAVDFLCKNSIERNKFQKQISHLIVDEYQDLNPAQISLLRLLTAYKAQIFAVGDDDQLIYSWRNVSSDNIVDFNNLFEGMKDYSLETNYRSGKKIVNSSQRLISYNERRVKKNIKAHSLNADGDLTIYAGNNLYDQLDYLGKYIKKILKLNNNNFPSVAVLTRKNISQLFVARKLDSIGIPRSQLGNVKLYSLPVSQRLLTYLRCIYNPKIIKGDDFQKIINRPNRFIPNRIIEKFSKEKNAREFYYQILNAFEEKKKYEKNLIQWEQNKKKVNSELNTKNNIKIIEKPSKPQSLHLTIQFNDLSDGWHRKNLDKFFSDIDTLNIDVKNINPTDLIQKILKICDFRDKSEEDIQNDEVNDEYIIDILMQESKSFFTLEDYIKHLEEKKEIELGDKGDNKHELKNKNSTNCIKLTTVHKAKGKEWETVILFDTTEYKDISTGNKNLSFHKDDNEEERRVFYVAMTRAKTNLLCTFMKKNPSKFLKESLISKRFLRNENPIYSVNTYIDGKENRKLNLINKISDIKFKSNNIKVYQDEIDNLNKRLLIERENRDELKKEKTVSPILKIFSNKMTQSQKRESLNDTSKEIDRLERNILEKKQLIENLSKIDFAKEKKTLNDEINLIDKEISIAKSQILYIQNLF